MLVYSEEVNPPSFSTFILYSVLRSSQPAGIFISNLFSEPFHLTTPGGRLVVLVLLNIFA